MSFADRRAIVRGKNDIGVLVESRFAKGFEHATDLGIEVLHRFDIGLLRIGIVKFIRHIQGHVRHGVSKVDEKWLLLILLDELDGLVGITTRDGALIDGDFDDFFALHQRSFPLGESRLGVLPLSVQSIEAHLWFPLIIGVIHIVRVRNPEVGIETVFGRQGFRMMAEMPFAKASGGVTLPFQLIRDGVLA